jgi:large subunit ribosomal protein L22
MATRQREKAIKHAAARDKRPQAVANYIRIPTGKIMIVLDLIRNKPFNEAVAILEHTNKSASPVILKILNSAASNAENNLNMIKDNLYVAECFAMNGPTLKRMMPRARGRADRILKYSSHIRIILDEKAGAVKTVAPKPAAKTTTAVKTTPVAKPATVKAPVEKKEAATKPAVAKTPVAKTTAATDKAPVTGKTTPVVKAPATKTATTKKEEAK